MAKQKQSLRQPLHSYCCSMYQHRDAWHPLDTLAKWSGYQPVNRKVAGLIPADHTWMLPLFLGARNLTCIAPVYPTIKWVTEAAVTLMDTWQWLGKQMLLSSLAVWGHSGTVDSATSIRETSCRLLALPAPGRFAAQDLSVWEVPAVHSLHRVIPYIGYTHILRWYHCYYTLSSALPWTTTTSS